jgi:hypothetical protein
MLSAQALAPPRFTTPAVIAGDSTTDFHSPGASSSNTPAAARTISRESVFPRSDAAATIADICALPPLRFIPSLRDQFAAALDPLACAMRPV